MAVVNTKSTAISNADASPAVLNNPRVVNGFLRESVGTVEVAAGDDNDSVFYSVRVNKTSEWKLPFVIKRGA